MPASSASIAMVAMLSVDLEPCSQSIMTQSKPRLPTISTICGEGNITDTPKAGSPAFSFSFNLFAITRLYGTDPGSNNPSARAFQNSVANRRQLYLGR